MSFCVIVFRFGRCCVVDVACHFVVFDLWYFISCLLEFIYFMRFNWIVFRFEGFCGIWFRCLWDLFRRVGYCWSLFCFVRCCGILCSCLWDCISCCWVLLVSFSFVWFCWILCTVFYRKKFPPTKIPHKARIRLRAVNPPVA